MPFPLLALIAPIVAAVLMWAFTRSPFVLMFAFLGPVVAIATMGDARRRARVDLREQHVLFEKEYVTTLHDIDAAHVHERTMLEQRASYSAKLVESSVRDPERWRIHLGESLNIRLGTGTLLSSLNLEQDPNVRSQAYAERRPGKRKKAHPLRSVHDLIVRASILEHAPVIVDTKWGIGVFGHRAEAAAVATSIAVQVAAALSPETFELRVAHDQVGRWEWVRELPHFSVDSDSRWLTHDRASGVARVSGVSFGPRAGGPAVLICVAEDEHSLPHDCRIVISVAGSRARIVRHPEVEFSEHFDPDYISEPQARRFATTLSRAAKDTFTQRLGSLPERAALSELIPKTRRGREEHNVGDARDSIGRYTLKAAVGLGSDGPVFIDLVSEGPHVIIGGTTGSGKSEVLVTWVLALAARYTSSDVNFLLVDFKGGAAFAPVQNLPHTVGVLTDLDPSTARRAILSLQAELRRREHILADTHVRSIVELPPDVELPRLVVIVDEFAAMATSFSEMHDLFADLAARGRSLGIHLILCTQRPAGTIREAVLANSTLRVSLRVNNSADSVAVIGTPDAAQIPKNVPGRSLLQRGGATAEAVQWAMASADDAQAIAMQSQGQPASRQRPWLDPLPTVLDPRAVPPVTLPALAFGLIDIPEEQRQVAATYDPVKDGNLFIVGSHRSGKSTVLSTLNASASDAVVVPANVEGAWDVITESLAHVRLGSGPSLLLVDDLDLIVGRFAPEYEAAFVDRLTSIVREGPRVGTTVAFTATVLKGRVQSIASLCTSTLVLRMRDKQDHVLVGGESAEYSAQLPPGGGYWRGHRTQVTFSTPLKPTAVRTAPLLEYLPGEIVGVVSARPSALRSLLEQRGQVTMLDAARPRRDDTSVLALERGSQPTIILGDADAWFASSILLGSLRAHSRLVFHGSSLTEFRSIAGIREIPPPLDSAHNTVVVLAPDGRMHRATL